MWLVFAGFFGWLFTSCSPQTPSPAENTSSSPDQSGYVPILFDISTEVGFDFVHKNGMSGEKYFVEMNGSGGAVFDYDLDGDLDIYCVQGNPIITDSDDPVEHVYTDQLFRNDLSVLPDGTRKLTFTNVTEKSGIHATGYGMGVAIGDYNNDGWIDLYITNWGPNQLWRNNGDGTFTDVSEESGTADGRWALSTSFLDYDRDGWMDLFVANYTSYSLLNDHPCFLDASGRRDYCGPRSYDPETDILYRNQGDGTFEDVTLETGLANLYGPGMGVIVSDFDENGWPDIFVANDGVENQMWLNQGGTRFEDAAIIAGTAFNVMGISEASMGVTVADFDNDGREDLFTTALNGESNTFYTNLGQGLFEDRSRHSGLSQPSWPFTTFGVGSLDYDNDGLIDLFLANGEVRIIPEQVERNDPFPLKQINLFFRNSGDGQFEMLEQWGGAVTDLEEVTRGVSVGDIDNDGDSDVVYFNNYGPARLLRNELGHNSAWIGIRVTDAGGLEMPGSQARLIRSDGTSLWRRSNSGGSYCSAHDFRILFGLGDDQQYEKIVVIWPDGDTEEWSGLELHRYHTLRKGSGVRINSQ